MVFFLGEFAELMRGVHVYRLEGGGEEEVEREYVFRNEGDYYEEIGLCSRMLTMKGFCASAHFEGMMNGVWLCIYVFDSGRHCRPDLNCIPTVLSIYRYSIYIYIYLCENVLMQV